MTTPSDVLLKAHYTAVQGTDPEYGQGAIERNEVAHREIHQFVWLILVEAPGDPREWERRLNEAVQPDHGFFTLECASTEEEQDVRSGKVQLQK